jgi:hypothetical protein
MTLIRLIITTLSLPFIFVALIGIIFVAIHEALWHSKRRKVNIEE